MTTATALPVRPLPVPVPSSVPPPMPAAPPVMERLRRFSVDEYHRMIREGFFGPEERCELLHGYIVQKVPRDPIHDAVLEIVIEFLRARLPGGWRVRPQMAMTTTDSEPEPDAAVVRGRPQDHFAHHPVPSEVALAVEVSNTTIASDRAVKGPLYAESGVPAYWIVNLGDRRVEVYTDPTGPDSNPGYRRRDDYSEGTAVPVTIGGAPAAPISVSDLLPPH
jgi:Uma2 family endonuclease